MMWAVSFQGSGSKKIQVKKMFDRIAFRYDLLNQLLSFGIHKRWRRQAIRLLDSFVIHHSSLVILDAATGTADFAIDAMALEPEKIIAVDLSEEMMKLGKEKIKKRNLESKIELLAADCENLPFPENRFDLATLGFGVRNFENLETGLSEICRVLKPSGTLAVLEFSLPEKFPVNVLYTIYLKYFCPFFGRIISGDKQAYSYLFRSVRDFPYGEKFKSILLKAGFSRCVFFPQTSGIATIYIAKK